MLRLATVGALLLAAASGCAGPIAERRGSGAVPVKIIAFNDFHGHLEPPEESIDVGTTLIPAGGVAYFASAIEALRRENPNNAVVAAGDLIGGSPPASSLFLDEPTILAMNLIGLDYNAVGNHEFDRGRAELLRMKRGGCEKHTVFEPCRMEPDFPGADFDFLAANTRIETGETLFPPYAIKSFGTGDRQVRVGFIGLTMQRTGALVTPAGIAGIKFGPEAESANALVPRLKAEGVEAIVLLIHSGAETSAGYNDKSCEGLSGELLPVLQKLDPEIDVVVSGHTHLAYACDYGRIDPERPFVVTSAGSKGMLLSDIDLAIDPTSGEVVSKKAENVVVPSGGWTGSSRGVRRFPADKRLEALVSRYSAAVAAITSRVVGKLAAPALKPPLSVHEFSLGNLIADAQLAATRAPENGGAQLAIMNPGGVRADLVPAADGSISYGQLFTTQPFGNTLVVKSFTGRQIRAILEQQFNSGTNTVENPYVLLVSSGFSYGFDLSKPVGRRIIDPRLHGRPLRDAGVYRVAMNSFLASGGDSFTLLREGAGEVGGTQDVDVLAAYFAANSPVTPPPVGRVSNLTPP